MIARAKQAQAEKSLQVGVIKHQNVAKEKISKMERKKRLEEAKNKEREERKLGKKTFGRVSTDPRSSGKIVKPGAAMKDRPSAPESGYKGTARPPPQQSSYKGTSGLASRKPPPSAGDRHRSRKEDRYLDTDEEDIDEEDEYPEDDAGGYSDASSDMEAGVFDVDEEENRALRAAKQEDEEELRRENLLKREKEERKRRLEALVAKSKGKK